jgi:hypothetical protein
VSYGPLRTASDSPGVTHHRECPVLDCRLRVDRFPRCAARTPDVVSRASSSGGALQGRTAAERKRIATAMQESLARFAQLREQMRKDGPAAVTASLTSMPEGDVRAILFALVVTTERAEDTRG